MHGTVVSLQLSCKMPGYSLKLKSVSSSSRILSLLVLKPCDLVELTCHVGSKATQGVVEYLEGAHERAGNSLQRAVIAGLLARSVHASRLVHGMSDELNSVIWWPRRGAELYNVCSLHLELRAAFATSMPVHTLDSLVECGQALQHKEPRATRSKLPQAALTLAQGICPSTKVNVHHFMRKSVRLSVSSSFSSHWLGAHALAALQAKEQIRP